MLYYENEREWKRTREGENYLFKEINEVELFFAVNLLHSKIIFINIIFIKSINFKYTRKTF